MEQAGWLARLRERLVRDAHMLWLAARDPRTPFAAKLVGGMVAAYAFSPIDLIPDFVPLLGLLDDLILVPLGIALSLRLIPGPLVAEFRATADATTNRPVSRAAAVFIVAVWLFVLAVLAMQVAALRYW